MIHRYEIGQVLDLRPAPALSNRPGGPCHVIACLPHDTGPLRYRVQCWAETNERVVDEADLSPSSSRRDATAPGLPPATIAIAIRKKH